MTNYEKIRAMSREQLAEFIDKVEKMEYPFDFCEHCKHWDEQEKECGQDYNVEQCPDYSFLDWLSWEAE